MSRFVQADGKFDDDRKTTLARLERGRVIASASGDFLEKYSAADPLREIVIALEQLHERVSSQLFTVGFIGTFSAGKSTLMSALIGQLEVGPNRKDVRTLLPRSAVPTSSCPVYVRSGRQTRFLVRFADVIEPEERPSDDRSIAAYTTDIEAWTVHRLPNDRARTVVGAEIQIVDPGLAGVLIDLPGSSSSRPEDEQILADAIATADCFVFVTAADRSLDSNEIALLRNLQVQLWVRDAPTFFFLTKVGVSQEINQFERVPEWQLTQRHNEKFVLEHFRNPETGAGDNRFLGKGFTPVELFDQDAGLPTIHDARLQLARFIDTIAGPTHLEHANVEFNIHAERAASAIASTLQAQLLPVEELDAERTSLKGALTDISMQRGTLEANLINAVDRTIQLQFAAPARQAFQNHLVAFANKHRFEAGSSDKAAEVQAIHNAAFAWMTSAKDSPNNGWGEIEKRCTQSMVDQLSSATRKQFRLDKNIQLPDARAQFGDLALRGTTPAADDKSPAGWQTAVPTAAGVASIVTAAIANAIILAPVGAILAAVAIRNQRKKNRRRAEQLDADWQAFIVALKDWSIVSFDTWVAAHHHRLSTVRSLCLTYFDAETRRLTREVKALDDRYFAATETISRSDQIRLQEMKTEWDAISAEHRADIVDLQPTA